MSRLLLDTSAYSAFMRGHEEARLALQRVEEICVNPISSRRMPTTGRLPKSSWTTSSLPSRGIAGQFVARRENVLIGDPTGTGKSHLVRSPR